MKVDRYGRVTMTRRQLCKLMLACSAIQVLGDACAGSASEWEELHEELKVVIAEYDTKLKGGEPDEQ